MNTTTITCPNCGMSKPVPNERIPRKIISVSCPSCKTKFKLGAKVGESNKQPLNRIAQTKTENQNPVLKKTIPSAPLSGVFIRFACYYIGFMIFSDRIINILGLDSINFVAGMLVVATTLSCQQFRNKNGRNCTKGEKKKIIIGISAINFLLQTALTLLLNQPIHAKMLFFIGVFHPIVIFFTVRLFFEESKEKEKPKGDLVKCHVCDKGTFEGHAYEHLGRKICEECWEMKHAL